MPGPKGAGVRRTGVHRTLAVVAETTGHSELKNAGARGFLTQECFSPRNIGPKKGSECMGHTSLSHRRKNCTDQEGGVQG